MGARARNRRTAPTHRAAVAAIEMVWLTSATGWLTLKVALREPDTRNGSGTMDAFAPWESWTLTETFNVCGVAGTQTIWDAFSVGQFPRGGRSTRTCGRQHPR